MPLCADMALFELKQDYGEPASPWERPTFKDCAQADIELAFFNGSEHADWHNVDGKDALVIFEDSKLKERSAHWEGGAKQNFDTGLYEASSILYIRVEDYGKKPKIGKHLVMDAGTDHKRTYTIKTCEDEAGVYRITMERVRQA